MILEPLTEQTIQRHTRIVGNVWKIRVDNRDYAIKAEKKEFSKTGPIGNQPFENKYNDMAWAIDIFVQTMADSPIPVWGRAIRNGSEKLMLRTMLEGMEAWTEEQWDQTLLQITDWCSDVSDFGSVTEDQTKKATLVSLLKRKEELRELGKGLAVDIFLGNRDRMSIDRFDSKGEPIYYVNFDNFFFTTRGRGQILYMDFWDPNSEDNFRKTFAPTDTYMGGVLKREKDMLKLAAKLAAAVEKKLKFEIEDPKQIAKGLEIGKQAIWKVCRNRSGTAITSRLRHCGIG